MQFLLLLVAQSSVVPMLAPAPRALCSEAAHAFGIVIVVTVIIFFTRTLRLVPAPPVLE